MALSDLASAIDDSFDIQPIHVNLKSEAKGENYYTDPRSDHWSVSDGTVLGSAIDDSVDKILDIGYRPRDGGMDSNEQPIPGDVIRRFTNANAAKRKKQQGITSSAAVEEDPADADAGVSPAKASQKKDRASRLVVPRTDCKYISAIDTPNFHTAKSH